MSYELFMVYSHWNCIRICAGKLMRGGGFGVVVNLIVGIIGGVLGGCLFGLIGISTVGIIGNLITSVVGAIFLLWIVGLLSRSVSR